MSDLNDQIEQMLQAMADEQLNIREINKELETKMVNKLFRSSKKRSLSWLLGGVACLAIGGVAFAATKEHITRWFLLDPSDVNVKSGGDTPADYIRLEPEAEGQMDSRNETGPASGVTSYVPVPANATPGDENVPEEQTDASNKWSEISPD